MPTRKITSKKMKENKINAAIQLLPGEKKDLSWNIIDKAIRIIESSGLNYKVCPFETVVEGSLEDIKGLIEKIRDESFKSGAEDILINLKLQMGKDKDIFIQDKMNKYESQN
jgi:uncharacterized protein YqgV (UPF0045/DUF77 family)